MTPFERADYAKTLLASDVFKLAYEDMRSTLLAQVESVGLTDIEAQKALVLSLQSLKGIKSRLERYVQDGVNEEHKQREADEMNIRRESLDKSRFGSIRTALGRFASRP